MIEESRSTLMGLGSGIGLAKPRLEKIYPNQIGSGIDGESHQFLKSENDPHFTNENYYIRKTNTNYYKPNLDKSGEITIKKVNKMQPLLIDSVSNKHAQKINLKRKSVRDMFQIHQYILPHQVSLSEASEEKKPFKGVSVIPSVQYLDTV
jgi:hypothetical protein